jgi:hypothetical protein
LDAAAESPQRLLKLHGRHEPGNRADGAVVGGRSLFYRPTQTARPRKLIRLGADLTILAKLACALSQSRGVPPAA